MSGAQYRHCRCSSEFTVDVGGDLTELWAYHQDRDYQRSKTRTKFKLTPDASDGSYCPHTRKMNEMPTKWLTLIACAGVGAFTATARAQTVDVAIALTADLSLSIDSEEFELQRRGYAVAVTDPRFLQAVQAGRTKPPHPT